MTLTDIEQFTVRRSSEEQSCASFLPPAGHFINGSFPCAPNGFAPGTSFATAANACGTGFMQSSWFESAPSFTAPVSVS